MQGDREQAKANLDPLTSHESADSIGPAPTASQGA